ELPVEQLLRMQREVLEAERRRGTEELRGTQTAIDHQVGAMREELSRLNRLVEEVERDRREHVGELTSQLREAGRQTQVLADTTPDVEPYTTRNSSCRHCRPPRRWGRRRAYVAPSAGTVDCVLLFSRNG